jgi:hypothetical protein
MEEKKQKQEKPEQITFEQLKGYYAELSQRYQQLASQNEQMRQALEDQQFNYMSFFVSMLFKVMDHPEMYNEDFVGWTAKEIEDALRSFKSASEQPEKAEKKEA